MEKWGKLKRIEPISYEETKDMILNKHYAQRMPSISYSYGLFINDKIEGLLTIGKPVSHYLCTGVMGEEYSKKVYELNRLFTNEGLGKNILSWFVGEVLRQLSSEDLILVSYADDGVGHKGYIYQATNWIYTGKTRQRTDKYTPDGKHSRHYTDEYNHLRKVRTAKHRYIYITNRKNLKKYKKLIKYPIYDKYPKGDNQKYAIGERMKSKIINSETGEVFYE